MEHLPGLFINNIKIKQFFRENKNMCVLIENLYNKEVLLSFYNPNIPSFNQNIEVSRIKIPVALSKLNPRCPALENLLV